MPFKQHGRKYDLVVFGATGYTGRLTVEHIATSFPPDLKWAIAGRSADKLGQLVSHCKTLTPDRIPPEIEVCSLSDEDLGALARKTFCLIATVGPYALFGEHAFKACAETGTHYLDCTPEVPWTLTMIKKYEAAAKASGACMFPQCAMESAPSDLLTWKLAEEARSRLSSQIGQVVMDLHELPSIPSGGTFATVLNLFEKFPLHVLKQSIEPYALSPVANHHAGPKQSFWSSVTGLSKVPGLGLLSTSATGKANAAIVFRTWGLTKQEPSLQKEFYGPNFSYRELMKAGNPVAGILMHYSLIIGALLLLLSPVRALARKLVFKPGDGPDTEKAKKEYIEFRAVAEPDHETNTRNQVFGKLSYTGSMYYLTAALLAQAAGTLLQDDSARLTGGIYTPACLGQAYIDRLQEVGVKFETEVRNL
ncbi:hypothetical protein A1O3_01465 [Capronia epimyces CBS 606.96]|uniref:Saccharopine dehydrogenase NADP binding domain-containing protein n=1 Tax=Capronia epimyces CBS 606.96 TaxID=1182542 RepID=W9ZEJ7_9EURO|nr:uncharacterized protein A1O3_01465 [Capronia epimyces CBS 606.96]EXJ92909.1 hypothetical protein A1O3_01465 [Capronia epimyces CBS 606.96]